MSQSGANRRSAEFVIADSGCWIRAGSRDAPFVAVPDRGWNPARYLGDDMVLAGLGVPVPTSMRDALDDLITAGLKASGRSARRVVSLTFVHPSHWGVRRVHQLRSLAQGLGYSVTCTPFAAAVSVHRQAPNHGGVTLVLESGELSTCASVVSADGSILECRFEPALGTADLRESDKAVSRFAALMNRAGIDRVLVTGSSSAELDAIAKHSARPATVAADAQGLVTARAPNPTHSLANRVADSAADRRGWLIVGAFLAAITVAGAFVILYGAGRPADTEPHTIRFGSVEVTVPGGWSEQESEATDSRQLQLDLTVKGNPGRRIRVLQNTVSASTTLGDAKRALERQFSLRSGKFSTPESVVYAGRTMIFFTEQPAGDTSEVRWHVWLDGGVQTSVGCQYAPGVWEEIATACEHVVESIRVVG